MTVRRAAGAVVAALVSLVLCVAGVLALLWVLALARERDDRVPPTTSFIATELGRVAVTTSGPPDGPRILLVHGTAAWSGFWSVVAEHLAGQGWRVIAVDTPPFGYSDRDPLARYDRTSQAVRLAWVIRATNAAPGGAAAARARPAVVVAHSFGAGAAVELALRAPQLVDRLVLVDPALGELDVAPSRGRGLLGIAAIGEPLTAATLTNPAAIGPLLRLLIARKEMAAPWLPVLRQPMRRPGTTAAYAAWLPALLTPNDGALSRSGTSLGRLLPPVALIWGQADTVTPIAQGEALARRVRVVSFVRLPGVGHIPHIEDPAAFRAALDQSLRSSAEATWSPSGGSGRTGRGPSPAL